jgi:hypothetical protein
MDGELRWLLFFFLKPRQVPTAHSCTQCLSGTTGPCQHIASGLCSPFIPDTTLCAAGAVECADFATPATATAVTGNGSCTGCLNGTSGPCLGSDGRCHGFFGGSNLCPRGTSVCNAPPNQVLATTTVGLNNASVQVAADQLDDAYSVMVAPRANTSASTTATATVSLQSQPCLETGCVRRGCEAALCSV